MMNQLKLTMVGVLVLGAACSDALAFGPPGPPPGGGLPGLPMGGGLPSLPMGGLPSFPTVGGSMFSGLPTPPSGIAAGPAGNVGSGNAVGGPFNSGNVAGGPFNSGNFSGNRGTFNNANVNVERGGGGYYGRRSYGGGYDRAFYDRGSNGRGAYFWGGYAAGAVTGAAASSDRTTSNYYSTSQSYYRTCWDPYSRLCYTTSGECAYATQ